MLLEAAVLTSALFVVIVLTSLAYNPRLWIQDFPAAMQAELAPLTRGERVVRALLAPVLVLVVVGVPLLSVLHLESVRGEVTFLEGFLHVWLVFMAVNIVDLVLVDWLIGVRWQPEFLSMPEIDPVLGHNTYRFHAVEHVKGTVLLTAVALVLGGLVAAT